MDWKKMMVERLEMMKKLDKIQDELEFILGKKSTSDERRKKMDELEKMIAGL